MSGSFEVAVLAAHFTTQRDQFAPAVPSEDLFFTLFGGDEETPCKYNPDTIDVTDFGEFVKVWNIKPGQYLYGFAETENDFVPLAFLRTAEGLSSGQHSYLDRVEFGYYFSNATNIRLALVLNEITHANKNNPRGQVITPAGLEVAITSIVDTFPPQYV